ncbi:MAG: methionyl-tRNA formyltransferase [Xanthobacteraceae bacterium]|nr:MAG: methionyl-tRNA formyltransferase [Xanthobacteraceae bacterium]
MSDKQIDCILVAHPDEMGSMAIDALQAGGYRIKEIWTSGREGSTSPLAQIASFASRRERLARRILAKAAAPVRSISRPWAQGLDRALEAAPAFDVLVCAGSYIIFPQAFLDRLQGRAVNLHPALLPHYRGPLPIHAMLIDGMAERYGGMTLHSLTGELDGGPIIGQRRVTLSDHDTPRQWQAAVMAAMRPLLAEDLRAYLAGRRQAEPQEAGSGSYHSARDVPLYAAPDQTVERITRYLATAPDIQRHALAALPDAGRLRRFVVTGSVQVIGPVTGEVPVVGLGHVEFDAMDARIRIRRLTRPERLLRKVRRRLAAVFRR